MQDHRRETEMPTQRQRRAREQREAKAIEDLARAGLTVEPIDDQWSLVASRFEYHHATGLWKERGTDLQGYSLLKLIATAKEGAAR